MSEQDALQKRGPLSNPTPSPRKLDGRWQWLVAPLMAISLVLHVLLLFVPLPEPETVVEEEPTEADLPAEEEAVDILSISDIPAPEPPSEPPPEQPQPPPEAPPPPAGAVPPPPDPEQIVEEEFLEEEFEAEELPLEDDFPEEETTGGFNPAVQAEIAGRAGGINPEFNLTANFPSDAWDLGGAGLSYWSPDQQACFFAALDEATYQMVPGTDRLLYLARNIDLVVDEDLKTKTYPDRDLVEDPNGWCGGRFFEVQANGASDGVWVSALEPAPATTLLILWTADPR